MMLKFHRYGANFLHGVFITNCYVAGWLVSNRRGETNKFALLNFSKQGLRFVPAKMFVLADGLRPSQQYFSHVGAFFLG